MSALMECVPNFSEGRRQSVVNAIVDAVGKHDVKLLHYGSDKDHNRTVVTFVGEPDKVMEAAYASIEVAAKLIDMEVHRGVHPRVGAADVVPFVPLAGLTMEDCALFARKLGMRVGDELGLPVYLYGAAALRPQRRDLPDIRRGEYEGLKQTITTQEHYPDYGPPQLGRAGAVIIGARGPLIAFNVYLATGDVRVARRIARAIRQSSGGLVGVRSLGFLVAGRAQVSLNLLDYKQTPIYRVVEMVRTEAARYGVGVYRCELIGMIPEDAMIDAASWYLQMHDFSHDQILERGLRQG